jgi:hypothetical protein
VALAATPSFAEESPQLRAGLRTGVEYTSTVSSLPATTLLQAGVDVDAGFGPLVLGGELGAAGGPFDHGVLLGGVHGGVQALTPSMHAQATLGLGFESISHICRECDSVGMAYAELRGILGYAFTHVEFGGWIALRADVSRDHVSSATVVYDVGGFTLGGGLTVAYLSR